MAVKRAVLVLAEPANEARDLACHRRVQPAQQHVHHADAVHRAADLAPTALGGKRSLERLKVRSDRGVEQQVDVRLHASVRRRRARLTTG